MSSIKPPRAVRTDVTLSFGLVSFSVDLVPAVFSETSKAAGRPTVSFRSVCPTCDEAHLVTQQYVCSADAGHGPFSIGECAKAREIDEGLIKVTDEQVAAIKTGEADSEPDTKSATLEVFPAAQVEDATIPAGSVYRLRPHKGSAKAAPKGAVQAYALVHALAAANDVAFVCEISIKSIARLYRVVALDGVLTLIELARPESKAPTPVVDITFDDKLMVMGEMLVTQATRDFDPDEWADGRLARIAALDASLTNPGTVAETPLQSPGTPVATSDLFSLLEASVAAAA